MCMKNTGTLSITVRVWLKDLNCSNGTTREFTSWQAAWHYAKSHDDLEERAAWTKVEIIPGSWILEARV